MKNYAIQKDQKKTGSKNRRLKMFIWHKYLKKYIFFSSCLNGFLEMIQIYRNIF